MNIGTAERTLIHPLTPLSTITHPVSKFVLQDWWYLQGFGYFKVFPFWITSNAYKRMMCFENFKMLHQKYLYFIVRKSILVWLLSIVVNQKTKEISYTQCRKRQKNSSPMHSWQSCRHLKHLKKKRLPKVKKIHIIDIR